jgi:hypothetical protein
MLEITKDQLEIIKDPARFKDIVAGRRWGKTHLSLFELLINEKDGAWRRPKMKNWFVSPTYRQSKNIAWQILKDICYEYPRTLKKKPNESELSIEFVNGSIIELKGADNEDSLRGVGLNRVVLDEFAYMKPEAWKEVLRPALSDKKGSAMFIGTPDGFNHFYDFYQKGLSGEGGFKSWFFRTIDSEFVDPAEVEAARKELDEKTFRQEYEASFEAATGRVYYAFDRIKNKTDLEYNAEFQTILCLDFNVNPMCWTILQSIKNQDFCVDEIVRHNTNTEEMAKAVGDVYGYNRPFIIYGDYSGTFRSTNSRSTDYNIIQQILPYAEIIVKPNPIVVDRVNAVNSRLCSASGIRNLFINIKNCPTLVKDMEQVVWKEGKREIDKDNIERTHSSDGLGYYIEYNYGLKGKVTSTIRRAF